MLRPEFPGPLLAFPFVVGLTAVLANTPGNTLSLQVGPPPPRHPGATVPARSGQHTQD